MIDKKLQQVDIDGEFLSKLMRKYGDRVRDLSKEFAREIEASDGLLNNESHGLVSMFILILFFSDFITGQCPTSKEMDDFFKDNFQQCFDAAVRIVADMNDAHLKTTEEEDDDDDTIDIGSPSVH